MWFFRDCCEILLKLFGDLSKFLRDLFWKFTLSFLECVFRILRLFWHFFRDFFYNLAKNFWNSFETLIWSYYIPKFYWCSFEILLHFFQEYFKTILSILSRFFWGYSETLWKSFEDSSKIFLNDFIVFLLMFFSFF